MSDYISLVDLGKLSDDELFKRWNGWEFPFDHGARCGRCLTEHALFNCSRPQHFVIGEQVRAIAGYDSRDRTPWLRANLDELYALRLFYRDLYASNPPELDAIPKESIAIPIQIDKENEYAVKA